MVDRLLDAVRGAFPDMADIVASTLRLQFGAVLLDTLADAQRFQFLALAADDPDGPEAAAIGSIPDEAVYLSDSGEEAPSIIMRRGVDLAMAAYGAPVPEVGAERRRQHDHAIAQLGEQECDRKVLLRQLDVALNGEAGAATRPSLCDLVAQVERQQRAVSIVNFDDGMVINFRAPDGRRATFKLSVLLDSHFGALAGDEVIDPMREAIAAYPSAGPRVPVRETVAEAAEKRAAGIKPDNARNLGVQRAPVKP